jgi:subtilisin family serine protease
MNNKVIGRCAAASMVALVAAGVSAPAMAGEKIANSYICVFKKDAVGKADVSARANAAAHGQGGAVTHTYANSIRGFSANISAQGMQAMRLHNPNIAYCEQDQVMTLVDSAKGKPGGGGGTPTPTPAQTTPWGITRVNGGASGVGKTAWIIDTGIDAAHPDLTVDTSRGAYFAGRSLDDENGHGTHVSGTIAAKNNTFGVIGVAAGATVVPVRVLDRRGSGSNSGVIAGVDFVAAHGRSGDVANMSLGGSVSTALDQAVEDAAASSGVKFALAAGNETDDADNHSPARAEGPNIYTVSAIDSKDNFASFSNYGSHVDFAEPGVSVYSTYKGQSYATLSGTSMATPHLAGLLLLGAVRSGGIANGDPDGHPDTIGVH